MAESTNGAGRPADEAFPSLGGGSNTNPQSDDLLEVAEPFDAGQWALHGLLSVYYESDAGASGRRAEAILERIRAERRRSWLMLRIGGLAVAACMVIGLFLIWSHTGGGGRAFAKELQEFGYVVSPPLVDLWLDPGDKDARAKAEQAVAEASAELEVARRIGPPTHDPWIPWTKLYRNLRALGQWDKALLNAKDFVAYAKEEYESSDQRYSMYYSALTDLGNIYLAIGDYENALAYHQQSLGVAREYQEWRLTLKHADELSPILRARRLGDTMAPRLWSLCAIAAARNDLPAAWEYLDQAEDLLHEFFRLKADAEAWTVADQASLWELALAADATNDRALDSMVVKVREHLLRRARLARVSRDLEAASEALRMGSQLPSHPYADESRLDFSEPMERLRIALARGEFAIALEHADDAEQHTGPRHFDRYPDHPPIRVLARAELRFHRGVALAGLDGDDPEGARLVESAVETIEQIPASLPQMQRERFRERFADWRGALIRLNRVCSDHVEHNARIDPPLSPEQSRLYA